MMEATLKRLPRGHSAREKKEGDGGSGVWSVGTGAGDRALLQRVVFLLHTLAHFSTESVRHDA